jgi:adenylylsulfate kinase
LNKARILWITGIPASGKTTLARRIVRHYREQGIAAEVIDGDDVRKVISADLGFSREDRLENNRRIAWIATLLARNGVLAVVASVSPFKEGRAQARGAAKSEDIQFTEIYTRCSQSVAQQRDMRGIYELKNVTGLGAPYEVPTSAEIIIDTERLDPDQALTHVLERLSR